MMQATRRMANSRAAAAPADTATARMGKAVVVMGGAEVVGKAVVIMGGAKVVGGGGAAAARYERSKVSTQGHTLSLTDGIRVC